MEELNSLVKDVHTELLLVSKNVGFIFSTMMNYQWRVSNVQGPD